VESQDRGSDPGDATILVWATSEERILVTMDKDFGNLVFLQGGRHSGLVRLPDVPSQARIGLMGQVLEHHAEDLAAGAVVTVRGSRIRVTKPYQG
jgi:predicted nuclease of predicted toxin-antitoxin system